MKFLTFLLILLAIAPVSRASYVTEALAQMPAKNTADESVLSAKILSGGAPAIKELCDMLYPLGTTGKDDTKARDAITALVRHVGRPGGETDRALLSRSLCDALAGDADPEIKSFYICRLQDIGRDDAVPALTPLLADEKLGLYASAALERIATPAAVEALVKALPASIGARRIGIIKSLGALRAADASAEIRKAAGDDDKAVRMTALWALANFGDSAVPELLSKSLDNTKSSYDRSRIYSYMILHIRRQFETGAKKPAADACVAFLTKETPTATPTNTRIAAARLLTEIEGQESLGVLLPLAEKGDVQFRAGALDAIAKIPGDNITPALVGRLKAVTAADVKIELLNALAKRNDAAARPAVIEAAKETDPAVRLAAINTLVALGRDEAIAPLVDLIVTDTTGAKPAADALARIAGDKPLAAAAGALAAASPKSKATLLELLAARGATAQKDAVLKQATDADDSVRLAAFKAMEKLGGEADAPKLIELAVAAKDDTEAAAALKAAAASAAHSADADQRAQPFVAALAMVKGPRRITLEKAVAKVGGAKALEIVVADLKSDDKATRQGALAALSEWQSADAIAPLLTIAKSADADEQATAIRGVVQVIRANPNIPAADKAAAYKDAIAAAKRPEEKRMILGAIAAEHGQEMFDLAVTLLDEKDFKPEASLAVIKTAIPQPKGQPGLKGPKVIEALKEAIPTCPDGGLKADAQRYLKTIEPRK